MGGICPRMETNNKKLIPSYILEKGPKTWRTGRMDGISLNSEHTFTGLHQVLIPPSLPSGNSKTKL